MPGNRVRHDLPIYARVLTELVGSSPLLQIEEVTEKLKHMLFVEQAKTDCIPKVAVQNRSRLLEFGQQARRGDGILFRPGHKRIRLGRF